MYNVKIIEFGNGTSQVRVYGKPMVGKSVKDSVEFLENPFGNGKVRVTDEFREVDKGRSSSISLSRTKNKIMEYARSNKWEYFVTLTYDGSKVDRYSFSECMRLARQWMNNQRKNNAAELKYLIVPEQHKDGAWHIHALVSDIGDIRLLNSPRKGFYSFKGWKYGFSDVSRVRDTYKASSYIAKYVTKSVVCHTPGKQRYYVSNNLKKPTVSTFLECGDDLFKFLEKYEQSTGLKLSHSSSKSNDYMSVLYIEFS